MGRIRLGVNVDHVATLREARKTVEPDPVTCALIAEIAGADGITVHLRIDRRHIKERDLELLRKVVKTRLNLEMAVSEEMINVATSIRPDQVTLVPERPGEVTTEGGLDIISNLVRVKEAVDILKESGIEVSIFIDPDILQVEAAKEVGADAIEIHTGIYAKADEDSKMKELERIYKTAEVAVRNDLKVHAGHDLNYRNIVPILKTPGLVEVNIGHAIIARAVYVGIFEAVKEMREIIDENS
ncbi:MAG: pyridoxine 5'-phosphate synthase [Thermosulfidibacteraceae bacterium]|jgi:pyridoxine 5-phosphate synthase